MKKFLQQGNDFLYRGTEKPGRVLAVYLGISLVLWTLQCSLLQNILGLDILETVTWGAQFALGHAKHPPLSGWLGYAFSCLSGHADWGLYLLAELCLVTAVWFVYRTAKLFWDDYAAATSALLLHFLYFYLPSEMKFSTYFVEMALIPLSAFAFFSALQKQSEKYWLLFGFLCGMGMLNKYSFGLQIAGFALVMFTFPAYRKQLLSWRPWSALLFFFLVLTPHLHWLWEHDFVCFRHVSSRLHEKPIAFLWLIILLTALYPFGIQLAILLLARLKGIRTAERKPFSQELFSWALLLTLLPVLLYLVISLCGEDAIVMWLCSSFSWTGVAVVALFPFAVNRTMFHRVTLLLYLYAFAMFTGCTADLLFNSGKRIHTKPEAILEPVNAFWRQYRTDPIPTAAGDRWYTCVLENYLPHRPPACEAGDPVFLERSRDTLYHQGGLLIGRQNELEDFCREIGCPPIPFQIIQFPYQAPLGEKKTGAVAVGYLPPLAAKKLAR